MAASQVSWFLYLFGFFLLFSGVLSSPKDKASTIVVQNPNLIRSTDVEQKQDSRIIHVSPNANHPTDLELERAAGISKYTENFRVNFVKVAGFTGFRSVFQWKIGKAVDNTNYGIHNAMAFSVNDSSNGNVQLLGQIGIYSNGSQIGVHLSLDSVASSTPGSSFKCSNDFPFYNGSHACFNSNYNLISNAIYYLDVEISDKTIRGYISQPQTNFSNISNPSLPRYLIGEIKWFNKLASLSPDSYWIGDSYKSCNLASDITTFNYIPEIYSNMKRQKATEWYSVYLLYLMCSPLNNLALQSWGSYVYISRPSPIINGTKPNSLYF